MIKTPANDELLDLSLTRLATLIRDRDVSPVDVMDACLRRIAVCDPEAHAFISVYDEQARSVARASEAMISAGYPIGPLHGVPVALKDNICLKGLRTTAGSKILAHWKPTEDATVAAHLRASGAIIVGKTNMHEFAWGGTSANPHYGYVRNAWDPSRFPAGSSGGSGVAVAARMCFGALGTDTGGSVRLPAAVNGVVGLRPTIGRVSNFGVVPLAWSMDTVGPMTRTVEDCALMLNAIAGHDRRDDGSASVPTTDYAANLERGAKGLRIGVISGYSLQHLQPAVLAAITNALKAYEALGAIIVELEMPDISGNVSAQLTVEACEPSAYHQRWLRERPNDYGEDVRLLLRLGELHFATQYIQAQRYRALLRSRFVDAFRQVDVVICPTLPFTATPLGATTVLIEGAQEEDMLSAIMQFTGAASLTGLPALSVPCGFDAEGLPIGMQLIGRPFDESTLFQLGVAFQRATKFHLQKPEVGGRLERPPV